MKLNSSDILEDVNLAVPDADDLLQLLKPMDLSLEDFRTLETFGYDFQGLKAQLELRSSFSGTAITPHELLLLHIQGIKDEVFEGKKFQHYKMAEWLAAHKFACKLDDPRTPQEQTALLMYDKGKYQHHPAVHEGLIYELIPALTRANRKEVLYTLYIMQCLPHKPLAPPHLIPFKSRIYDLEKDCFLDYSPEYIFLNRLPYDYNPDAAYQESIDKMMRNIADDNVEVLQLLYEAFGSCFYSRNDIRGSFWLYGKGRNGKSTLLNALHQMIGKDNVSALAPEDIDGKDNKFRVGELFGKLANIGDDIDAKFIEKDSNFKKVVTGEAIMREVKGDPNIFPFTPYAKCFFSLNGAPRVSDKSEGFYSRVHIIPLNHVFDGCNNDTSLKARKWSVAEMEYLVKLSMDGLKRVLANGGFTEPEIVKAEKEEIREINDPLFAFVNDKYNGNRQQLHMKSISGVFEEYRKWSEHNNLELLYSLRGFSKQIKDAYKLTSGTGRPLDENGKPVGDPQQVFKLKR